MREFNVSYDEVGIRLNKYLQKIFNKTSVNFIYKMLRKKNILLNDKKATGDEHLKEGDNIKIYVSEDVFDKFSSIKKKEPENDKISLSMKSILKKINYEDENIIIYEKAKGELSQKSKKDDISVNEILQSYMFRVESNRLFKKLLDEEENEKENKLFNPSVVNRLDTNTRGLIIFAKNYMTARNITKMIREKGLKKHYLAFVNGNVQNDSDELISFLKKDEKNNKSKIYDRQKLGTYKILTRYKVLKREKDYTILDVEIVTGKSHQIRAQFSHIGYPLLGDKKYMSKELYEENVKKYNKTSQELICYKLQFGKFDEEKLKYLNDKIFILKGER